MNDSQCKTTDQADVLWFVNCPWRGWVASGVPSGDRFTSLRVIAHQLHHLPRISWVCASCKSRCSVSFLSPVRRSNGLAPNQDPPSTTVLSPAVASLRFTEIVVKQFPAGYVSCRNVFSSSVSPSISATVRCNDCIAAATCVRKCL